MPACTCDYATGECQAPAECKAATEMLAGRAEIGRLRAALIHTRTFLKTYQRSNANWHNDGPTYDFIRTVLDPVINDVEQGIERREVMASTGCGCGLEREGCMYPRCPDGDLANDECDHIDYDADILTGIATCADCGHRWMQTDEEIAAQQKRYAAYDAYIAKFERQERWRQVRNWFRSLIPRRRKTRELDDEIPF